VKITALRPFVLDAGGGLFVKVDTDEGHHGLGFSGLGRQGSAVAEVIRSFEPDVVGQDPFRIEHLWQVMFRGGFFPGGVVQSAAVSAVDIALWDIKGKALGVPVYELLGGCCRDKVVCYPHIGGRHAIDALVDHAKRAVDDGWKFVRWGMCDPAGGNVLEPRRAVRFGIEQVAAVREAVGDDIEITFDVHTRLDPPWAIEFCNGVKDYRPFFVEDPLRSEGPQSLRHLRQHTTVPLAVGEQWDSKWRFQQAIEEDLMDYCRIDLGICGGITEGRKIAGWCETHYIPLAIHSPQGPVSTAASLHLSLASALVGVQELPRAPMAQFAEEFPVQMPFEDGYLLVPDAPGLGIKLNESMMIEDVSREPSKGTGFVRDDGSYTNW
jgi:L-alanine-DL-glutamate epimerase-like enolase superfamily enzyme